MADHHWVHDHIASYLAGGLDAVERAELEAHLAGCGDCARAVEETRRLDQELAALFTAVRPTADLEDRAIRRLRLQGASRRASPLQSKVMRVLLAAAAVLLLGIVGAGMSVVVGENGLLFGDNTKSNSEKRRALDGHKSLLVAATDGRQLHGQVVDSDSLRMEGLGSVTSIKPVWELAEESRRRHLLLFGGRSKNLDNDDVGNDSDLPTNYNVDRVEDVSVPGGKFKKEGETWGRLPEGGSGADGEILIIGNRVTRDNVIRREDREGQYGWHQGYMQQPNSAGGAGGSPPKGNLESRGGSNSGSGQVDVKKLKDIEAYFSYSDQRQPGEAKPKTDAAGRPSGSSATGRPDNRPAQNPPGSGEKAKSDDQLKKAEESKDTNDKELEKLELNEQDKKDDPKEPAKAAPPIADAAERKIIRSGELEFEVDSFDSAVERVEKIVAEEKGVVATINSDKLPNGKMRGSVVLRVPPQNLDDLIKKLRALGELKRQRLGSQDITKHYYDMDSRLKAARIMEKRLLEIIAKGGGMVKDLIEAEKELGIWRTRIEELEGEVRYYNNLVSLATLTIILTEKDIRTAYAVIEHRKVDMGIEVEDVEAAQRKAQELILQAKGRVNRSELRKGDGGSLQAILNFEAPPDAAGPLQDSLKQLGVVIRQEVDQSLDPEGGVKRPLDIKVTKANAQFQLSLFNLATYSPEQTVHITLAAADVADAYKKIADRVEKAAIRIVTSNLDQARADQATATLNFEVKTPEADGILALIKQAGEVTRLQEVETGGGGHITKAKRGFKISFVPLASVPPREVVSLNVVTTNVPKSYQALQEAVVAAKGRVVDSRLDEPDSQNVTAELLIDIPRGEEGRLKAALERAGAVMGRSVKRDTQSDNKLDTKIGYSVRLISQAALKPREIIALGIEVPEVEKLVGHLNGLVADAKGRSVSADVSRGRSGEVSARVIYQVPLLALHRLADEFKREGHVSFQTAVRNPQVPENELAIGQLEVTLSSPRPIVGSDEGFAASFRNGLEKTASVVFTGLAWVVAGFLITAPIWLALLIWYVVRTLRGRKKVEATT